MCVACQIKGIDLRSIEAGVKETKWEFALSLLSVLLSVLIPLAPVNFSFCTNLYPAPSFCLSQTLKGIALGHSVSLLPLSALSIPLLHSPRPRGCWFKLLFSVYQPLPLLQRYHIQCQISSFYAAEHCELRADRATELLWEAKVQIPYNALSIWQMHLLDWVTMGNRFSVFLKDSSMGHIALSERAGCQYN